MSFEGYWQVLCKNGHLGSAPSNLDPDDGLCYYCGESPVWTNLVDDTNGDEAGKVELPVIAVHLIKCVPCQGTGKQRVEVCKHPDTLVIEGDD